MTKEQIEQKFRAMWLYYSELCPDGHFRKYWSVPGYPHRIRILPMYRPGLSMIDTGAPKIQIIHDNGEVTSIYPYEEGLQVVDQLILHLFEYDKKRNRR